MRKNGVNGLLAFPQTVANHFEGQGIGRHLEITVCGKSLDHAFEIVEMKAHVQKTEFLVFRGNQPFGVFQAIFHVCNCGRGKVRGNHHFRISNKFPVVAGKVGIFRIAFQIFVHGVEKVVHHRPGGFAEGGPAVILRQQFRIEGKIVQQFAVEIHGRCFQSVERIRVSAVENIQNKIFLKRCNCSQTRFGVRLGRNRVMIRSPVIGIDHEGHMIFLPF